MARRLTATPDPAPAAWARTGEPLIWFNDAGHEVRTSPSYRFDCRARVGRPHVCLQLTLAGEGFYEDRRGRTPLPAGRAFLDVIPGPFRYGYPPDGREPYELLFVSVAGASAMRWCGRIADAFGHVLDLGIDSAAATLLASVVVRHREGALGDRYLASGLLYQLFMAVLSRLSESRVSAEPAVGLAVRRIEQQAHDPRFRVAGLAESLGCSREHLSRRFHVAMGVSPSEYLAQHRIRRAAEMIRQTDQKLDAVARRCGLGDANYLCRVFRQRVGVTPGRFRQQPWIAVP